MCGYVSTSCILRFKLKAICKVMWLRLIDISQDSEAAAAKIFQWWATAAKCIKPNHTGITHTNLTPYTAEYSEMNGWISMMSCTIFMHSCFWPDRNSGTSIVNKNIFDWLTEWPSKTIGQPNARCYIMGRFSFKINWHKQAVLPTCLLLDLMTFQNPSVTKHLATNLVTSWINLSYFPW